jgi:hypothetical protein
MKEESKGSYLCVLDFYFAFWLLSSLFEFESSQIRQERELGHPISPTKAFSSREGMEG